MAYSLRQLTKWLADIHISLADVAEFPDPANGL